MNGRLEDWIGRILIIIIFLVISIWQVGTIFNVVRNQETIDSWQLVLLARVFGLVFLFLTVFLTIIRLPPIKSAFGMGPRITSISGTFCLMLLIILPTGKAGAIFLLCATGLILVGTLLSIWCIVFLGRSFSIMATARRLVTHGPYSIVRHPLYLAEAVTSLGVVIAGWSVYSIAVGLLWAGLQYRRMLNEEKVLLESFPEYNEYASRVPMLLPFRQLF